MNSSFLFAHRHLERISAVRHTNVRQAFSLVEMLVALAIFLVLLTAVFVPIKLAGDLSGVATSRSQTQQAAVDGIRLIKTDISKAIVILPNDRMAGVTDVYPYTQPPPAPNVLAGNNGYPYRRDSSGYQKPATVQGNGTSAPNACGATASPAPNTARLDLILPANTDQNSVDPNLRHNSVLVSYYSRRRDITKVFDPINNPVVLYRAQIPFQYNAPPPGPPTGPQPFPAWEQPAAFNADLSNQRFDTAATTPPRACVARSLQWLTMNQYGEFDLTRLALPPANAPITPPSESPVFGSHQLVLPRDTALLTPNAAADTTAAPAPANMSLVPDTTFVCSDANKDGKIDTVTVQLSVGQYDQNSVNRRSSGTPGKSVLVPQVARTVTETVFDPNIQ